MKSALSVAAIAAAAVLHAQPVSAQDVQIRNAVARVVVLPEDRNDIGVEVTQARARLPAVTIYRENGRVRIEGRIARRGVGPFSSSGIGSCHAGRATGTQPGEGAVVEVRGAGGVRMEDAPMIVLRTPRDVDVRVEGAVFGAIGRGARSVELGAGGCGDWNVANVDGDVSLHLGGSGAIRAGASHSLEASIGGSGSISAGATGDLEASIGGSGDIVVASMRGAGEIAVAGSGDVTVNNGRADRLSVSIAGSGGVRYGGTTRDLNVSIVGSGDVHVSAATGSVSRSVMGSGQLLIGR